MMEENHTAPAWINQLSGRITLKQVCRLLGFSMDEGRYLVAKGHLKPLANPNERQTKYFLTADIIELVHNRSWYERATRLAYTGNRTKSKRGQERLAA